MTIAEGYIILISQGKTVEVGGGGIGDASEIPVSLKLNYGKAHNFLKT